MWGKIRLLLFLASIVKSKPLSEQVQDLVQLGQWPRARELVTAAHKTKSKSEVADMSSKVRLMVQTVRSQLDELLVLLNPNHANVATVTPAFQWAQNSSHVFLSIKFSQRWSSPGALQAAVQVNVSDCCWNMTGTGEHSGVRKQYKLDLDLFGGAVKELSSWSTASVGKMSAVIAKGIGKHGRWSRLLKSAHRVQNMAVWTDLQNRWNEELTTYHSRNPDSHVRLDPAIDPSVCQRSVYHDIQVPVFCEKYFPVKANSTVWLVKFFDPQDHECQERSEQCVGMTRAWKQLGQRLESFNVGNAAVVDCRAEKAWCARLKVGHLPHIRRYRGKKRAIFYGNFDELEELMKFAAH